MNSEQLPGKCSRRSNSDGSFDFELFCLETFLSTGGGGGEMKKEGTKWIETLQFPS